MQNKLPIHLKYPRSRLT